MSDNKYKLTPMLPYLYKNKFPEKGKSNNEKLLDNVVGSTLKPSIDYAESFKLERIIDKATWGLTRWEEELGIRNSEDLPDDVRRRLIRSKLIGRGKITEKSLKDMCEEFSGGCVEITKDYSKFYVHVKFAGSRGIPEGAEAFKQMLEDLLPAWSVLELEFIEEKFIPMTWDRFDNTEFSTQYWDDRNLTWDKFEMYHAEPLICNVGQTVNQWEDFDRLDYSWEMWMNEDLNWMEWEYYDIQKQRR